jgi:hypothetical protein
MKFKSVIFYFAFTGAIILVASCGGKDNPDNGSTGKDTTSTATTTINGTSIVSTNNLIGLITNSTTGKGIPGVPVTDGYSYTVTDANGVYQMKGNVYARKVYYTKPAGYETELNSRNAPGFYSDSNVKTSGQTRTDYSLTPCTTSDDNWTLFVLSDPQCRSDANVSRFTSETIPDLVSFASQGKTSGTVSHPVAVTVGDLIFDNLAEWKPMQSALTNVKLTDGTFLPIYNCIGNHDHNNAETSDYNCVKNFVNYLGPTDYSFDMGKAHVIVMDDIMYAGSTTGSTYNNIDYNGGFTTSQYKWLQADLAKVADKENKLLIMCFHIPFRGGASTGGSSVNTSAYYAEFLTAMTQFHEAHIMIGHTHYPQNYIHTGYVCKGGKPIYEHILGATCGAWWSCNLNVEGSPNMYGVFQIKGNTLVDNTMKATAHTPDYQILVFDGGQVYKGTTGSYHDNPYKWGMSASASQGTSDSQYKGYFIAKVWNSDDTNWSVKLVKDGQTYDMKRVTSAMINASSAAYFYDILNKTTTTYMSSHYDYYVVKAPSGDPATETGWQVVATQNVPGGVTNTYYASSLQTDYAGY